MRRRYNNFTLIELLIVIAIISILMSMLIPGLKKARNMAIRSACATNLKNIGTAVNFYANDFDGYTPRNEFVSRYWYVPDFTGFIEDDSNYLKKGSDVLYCPTMKKVTDDYISYNIISCSDTSAAKKADGQWDNYKDSYAQISVMRMNNTGMLENFSCAVPRSFSRRVLAADYFYCKDPYFGASVYSKIGGAHEYKGGNSVFADGHVKWFINKIGRTPVAFADYGAIKSAFFTGHWSQRPYIGVYDGVYGE